ncbi:MAG: phosphatidylserine decarboxylase family protein [Geobacteraceae bacterium]|nr:phosphatidylserine decarboxylase family protein [Geobacteraceae bacterium]
MRNQNTPIAVEGYPFIAVAGGATVALVLLSWKIPALLALTATLYIAYFFRNPQRIPPPDEHTFLAPADGVVTFLGKAREVHLGAEMMKVSIFMSVFNVHVNRVPCTGTVVDTFYRKGKFYDARDEKATFENEQSGIILETERGDKVVVVQVAGLIARRIVSYPKKGDVLRRGQRFGLIRFGSRVDVYLPADVEIRVAAGERTVAGETILGRLP